MDFFIKPLSSKICSACTMLSWSIVKKNRPILVADRYTQFIKIRINQFLDHLGVYNLHLGYHKQKLPNLLLDIIQQGLEKLIESFGSVNLPHTAKVINLLQSAELILWQVFASNLFRRQRPCWMSSSTGYCSWSTPPIFRLLFAAISQPNFLCKS